MNGISKDLEFRLSLLSTSETANQLGITRRRVLQLVEDGILESCGKIGFNFVFQKSVIDEFSRRHRPVGRPRNDAQSNISPAALTMADLNASQPPEAKTKSRGSVALTIGELERKNGGRA